MMNIYQHFREDEQSFIDRVLDWTGQVNSQYTPYLTPFLNPRQLFIVQSIVGQSDEMSLTTFGGHLEAEHQRTFIHPSYFEPSKEDFDISLIEIKYPTKFAELSHGDILGTLMGSGIKRETLGDILTDGNRWQFFIDSNMEKFLFMNIERIGRTNVQLEKRALDEAVESSDKWAVEEIVVSSLRMDVVLAGALNVSRNRAKNMVNDKKIKLNWVEVDQVDEEVEEFDIISVRGFGRIQIRGKLGMTRKNNVILEIGIIDSNK